LPCEGDLVTAVEAIWVTCAGTPAALAATIVAGRSVVG
jgi:hypothetical protein